VGFLAYWFQGIMPLTHDGSEEYSYFLIRWGGLPVQRPHRGRFQSSHTLFLLEYLLVHAEAPLNINSNMRVTFLSSMKQTLSPASLAPSHRVCFISVCAYLKRTELQYRPARFPACPGSPRSPTAPFAIVCELASLLSHLGLLLLRSALLHAATRTSQTRIDHVNCENRSSNIFSQFE
jgi:hypothetical protein